MSVSILSILFMAISAVISVGVPIALFLFWRKRFDMNIVPLLVGLAAFVLFALGLEQMLHAVVLRPDAAGNIALRSNPILYMAYGCFAAGIFEESARFLSFKLLKKKFHGVGTGLSYGIGHGGVEAGLLLGMTMINNIVLAVMINSGTIDAVKNALQGTAAAQFDTQITALTTTQPYMFLVGGAERIFALAIQISLSVLVWYAVNKTGKGWLFPAAIALHALIDAPAALMQTGVLNNVFVVEGIVFACAVLISLLAVFTHRKLKENSVAVIPE